MGQIESVSQAQGSCATSVNQAMTKMANYEHRLSAISARINSVRGWYPSGFLLCSELIIFLKLSVVPGLYVYVLCSHFELSESSWTKKQSHSCGGLWCPD